MNDLSPSQPPTSWRDLIGARLEGRRSLALGTVGVAVFALVVWSVAARPVPLPELVLPRAVPDQPAIEGSVPGSVPAGPVSGPLGSGKGGNDPSGVPVVVHAAGQVVNPGVYSVPSESRVADVITAAGGVRDGSDLDQLNLATRVVDGDRVYVPRKGETSEAGQVLSPTREVRSASPPSGAAGTAGHEIRVDLNKANLAELDELPGVGPATAQAIIAYRTANGPFRSIAELMEVRGIGPAKLEALQPRVRV